MNDAIPNPPSLEIGEIMRRVADQATIDQVLRIICDSRPDLLRQMAERGEKKEDASSRDDFVKEVSKFPAEAAQHVAIINTTSTQLATKSLTKSRFFQIFLLSAVVLSGYSSNIHAEPKMAYAYHTFEFGEFGENKSVEVLDYRYGSSRTTGLHADQGYLATGHIPQNEHTFGLLPVGDSLYVKWKDTNTGRTYEKTVDLKIRLPHDMDHKVLHFSIDGPQLLVHVIDEKNMHRPQSPDCPVKQFSVYQCITIYPEQWNNF